MNSFFCRALLTTNKIALLTTNKIFHDKSKKSNNWINVGFLYAGDYDSIYFDHRKFEN